MAFSMRFPGVFCLKSSKILVPVVALAGTLLLPAFAARTHRSATSGHTRSSKKKASHQLRGQRQIDSERAREIQTALIREHYLSGEPSGEWDAESQAAMTKFQGDQGWQTKITPDSRALIKLGLGPNQESLKSGADQASLPSAAGTTQSAISGSNSLLERKTVSQ